MLHPLRSGIGILSSPCPPRRRGANATLYALTRCRCLVPASLLRSFFGLLHGDLIDVRQGPGTGGAFDGLDGDILHLLLGLSELFLERGNLSGVASESLLERLCAQFCQALFCLGILFRENHLVLEPGLHLLARLQRRCFDLLLKASQETPRPRS